MGERLSGGNGAIALLCNSVATGAGLVALILAFARISGAHFNPVITAADAALGRRPWREVPFYGVAQIGGAFSGVAAAHAMFGLPLFFVSSRVRNGPGPFLAEILATSGLLLVIRSASRVGPTAVSWAAGLYVAAAYWFTSSTSFANPAVTLARSVTNTFTGIRPHDAGPFVAAQIFGAALAVALVRWLFAGSTERGAPPIDTPSTLATPSRPE